MTIARPDTSASIDSGYLPVPVGAGVSVGAELVERWRDMGPTLWVVAGGAAAVWFLSLGLLAALTEPSGSGRGPPRSSWAGPSRRRSSSS